MTREKNRKPEFHFRDHPYQPNRWLADGGTTEYGEKFKGALQPTPEPSKRDPAPPAPRPVEAADRGAGSQQRLEGRGLPLRESFGPRESPRQASEQPSASHRGDAQDSLDLLQQKLTSAAARDLGRPALESYQVFKKQ